MPQDCSDKDIKVFYIFHSLLFGGFFLCLIHFYFVDEHQADTSAGPIHTFLFWVAIADLIALYHSWIDFPIMPEEHDFEVTDVEFHQIRAPGLCKNLWGLAKET